MENKLRIEVSWPSGDIFCKILKLKSCLRAKQFFDIFYSFSTSRKKLSFI